MKLPIEFLNKMKALLSESEFNEFALSYNQNRNYGLRVNTLKISLQDFLKLSRLSLEPVPWTCDGFYYMEGQNPGKHPYYHAGLYYIQEPSAMFPGAVIDAKPGERILDLCAAPGGKTVQIAAGMKGQGILVSNDINADRVKALVKNIELCGIKNAVVTNETPENLSRNFRGYFDKILVDAPCSGEGMFRKDEEAARSWGKYKNEKCASMQWDILQHVDKMLKPGGYIVYSTCTFSPEEDEIMISRFLEKHLEYELAEIPKPDGVEDGRPDWSDGNPNLSRTARLWPHRLKGEGHFVAMLKKSFTNQNRVDCLEVNSRMEYQGLECSDTPGSKNRKSFGSKNFKKNVKPLDKQVLLPTLDAFYEFVKENLNIDIAGHLEFKGNNLYYLPEKPPDLNGLKIAKFGWYLGEFAGGKFEPSHSMIMALKKEDIKNYIDFSSESNEVISYLKGETLMQEGKKGFTGVCVDGFTLGWAKQTGEMLKNLYPKGWRKMA